MLNQIKKFISRRGISRYRFWQDTGLGRDTAYRLCNDPTYIPTGNVLDKICGTYRVQPGDLLVWMPDDEVPAAIAQIEKSQQTGQEQESDIGSHTQQSKNTYSFLTIIPEILESA